MKLLTIKNTILSVFASIGSGLAWLLGGWSTALQALIIFMALDLLTGLAVALVFKKSPKTESGAAESHVYFKGIIRKVAILIAVIFAVQLDAMTGSGKLCQTAVIFFFLGNEGLSIVENLGLMGVPMPQVVLNALEILKNRKNKN